MRPIIIRSRDPVTTVAMSVVDVLYCTNGVEANGGA